jgi:hypothetical protein
MEQNMTRAVMGSAMRLPMALMALGVNMLARSLPSFPGMTRGGGSHDSSVSGDVFRPIETRATATEMPPAGTYAPSVAHTNFNRQQEQERMMPDTDLADDQAKWVRFSVWYLKRGHERILHSGEDLVTKNFGPDRYKVSKIYSFIREVEREAGTNPAQVPSRWRMLFDDAGKELRGDVADLLDVRFEVVDRTNREDLQHDQEQLDRLAGIENALHRISVKIMPD